MSLPREISVSIEANGAVDRLCIEFWRLDIPFQLERIGSGHREQGAVMLRNHLELLGKCRHGVEVKHKLVALECSSLIVKLSFTIEAVFGEIHLLMESAQAVIHRIRSRLVAPDLMHEA